MPVAGTATAQGPATEAAPPTSKRKRAPEQAHLDLFGWPSGPRHDVIDRMAPRDVVRLPAVSRQFRVDFADPARVATQAVVASAAALTLEARDASLETIGRLLKGPDGIPQLPPFFQTKPREAVTLRLGVLAPELAAALTLEAGDASLETIGGLLRGPLGIPQLPPILQAEPLEAVSLRLGTLAREVSDLPGPDQSARFSALLDLTKELGPERGSGLACLAIALEALDRDAVYDAFDGVANGLKLLPKDDPARMYAIVPLSHSIPVLHEKIKGKARRQLVEVLRPLPGEMPERVLNLPDNVLSPFIKDVLRQAIAEGPPSPAEQERAHGHDRREVPTSIEQGIRAP